MPKDKNISNNGNAETESDFFESETGKSSNKSGKETSSKSNSDLSESSENKSFTFIKLKDDGKTEIRYVYHISDIHIRNTQRHIEYKEVFDRTYQKIKNQIGSNTKSSLIVLTGDIMHTKTELSPEAIYIAYHFFKALNEIASVILIPGNHDCNLSNKNRLDALTPIVDDIGKLDNVYYLKKSGIYQYYNIIFGITSIFDEILVPAKKIGTEIYKNIKQKNKYKIALYHGAVHGAKTDVGYRMNNDQLLAEDFDGYDYVMLGDIHKFQYMNDKKTIAYVGSLIQQSYGESLDKHGILKWDLTDGESELMEIKNDYGYCTIRIVDGKIIDTKIPKKPRIRFILENTNQIQYQEVLNILEKEYQICEIVKESNFKTKLHNNSPSQKKMKEEVTAYSTQENIIKSYLSKKNLDKDKIKEIIDLHKKIYQKILKEKKDQVADIMHNAVKNQKWKLLELRFSNTLSYGKDNIINFRNYDPNKIIGIFAPNHYGKSAILDIILFCLFDKFSRGERRDILNKNEKNMSCSLLLSIGSQQYLIERIGQRSKNGLTVKIDVNFYLIKMDDNRKEIKENLNGIDKNDTNKKIVELIGDYNDYLTTCFCLQVGKSSNFIDMTQLQKKEYLNEILKLNVFEDCHNIAKDKLKKLSGQLKLLEQKIGNKSLEEIKTNIKTLTIEIKKLSSQKSHVNEELSEELDYIINLLSKTQLVRYNELSEYDLGSEENIFKHINNIKNQLNQKNKINLDLVQQELIQSKSEFKKIEEEEIHQSSYGEQFNENEIIKKKEEMIKKLYHIPKDFDENSVEKYLQEKEEIVDKIKIINKTLEKYKNQHLSEKMDRIDELKSLVMKLRKSLKPVDCDVETKVMDLGKKLSENEKIIRSITDKIFGQKNTLDEMQKEKIKLIMQIKKPFVKYNNNLNNELQKYSFENHSNDIIIKNVINEIKTWTLNHQKWEENARKKMNISEPDDINIDKILLESKKIMKELTEISIDFLINNENNIILKKITNAEKELDALSEFNGTKKEIDNLKQEKKLLEEKIIILDNKINNIENNKKNLEQNKELQKTIDELQKLTDDYRESIKKKNDIAKNLKIKISENENIINNHEKQIKENKKLKEHLRLIQEYHMLYIVWVQKNDYLKKWIKIKKEFDDDLNTLTNNIEKKKIELAMYKKDIDQYLEFRKDFDDKSTKTNLYQLYVQVMNYNGLPYEMLKTYLPLIESDVNQILHSMVNFNIEFMFYDEEHLEEQKNKQLKSNMGSIDVNICYQDMKPYTVQLASGFERFIISLAIRMTLCQISLTAKPNFLIIDEGWSCLDSENLNNVGTIMDYIKTQYEHIIIISHLEELKNQADYVVNIEKNNGYSFIKTDKKIIINRNKKFKKSIKSNKIIVV